MSLANAAPSSAAPATRPADRVPLRQKIAYGLGSSCDMWGHWLYPSMAYPVFNLYLGVPPHLIGIVLMVNRLADALSDPFFGWVSDNTRTRFGRRRPFILVGAFLAGLGLPVLFLASPAWSTTQLFLFMLSSALLYVPLMSCFNMPYQSLGAELTPDYNERTAVMSFKGALQKVAELALYFALPFTTLAWFTDPATGKQNTLLGAQVYCAGLGLLMIAIGVIIFFTVKERYYAHLVQQGQEKVKLRESFYETLRCAPFRIQLGMSLAFATGTSMVSALGYYATVYVVCGGDSVSGNWWNARMGIAYMAGGFLAAPAFAFLARRLGKQRAAAIAIASGIAAFGGTWWLYTPAVPWLQVLASGGIGFASGGFWMLLPAMGADIMDYDELNTGKRREGAFSACGSWISKVGMSLGAGAAGFVLNLTGFNAALAVQSPDTILLIRVMLAAIPVAGLTLAWLILLRYPLGVAQVQEIRRQLEARRGTV